jgi:cytochrome c
MADSKQLSPISYSGMFLVLALLAIPLVVDLSLRGTHKLPPDPIWQVPESDAEQGRQAIVRHGCGACHTIPGIRVATGRVGPQLEGFRRQIYVAGVLANNPENLAAWIERPREINPQTAMPNLGVTPRESRNMAAYLYANP